MALTRMSLKKAPVSRAPPSYGRVASPVLASRFSQLYYLIAVLAVTIATVLALFLETSWIRRIFSIFFRSILIAASFGIIPLLRKAQTHVRYLPYLSAIAEYIDRFRSRVFSTSLFAYLSSSILFFSAYLFQVSDTTLISPSAVNSFGVPLLNERSIYFHLVFPAVLAFSAAVVHVALDVDRLEFCIKDSKQLKPRDQIKKGFKALFIKNTLISIGFTLGTPTIYFFVRPFLITAIVSLGLVRSHSYSGVPVSPNLLLHTFAASFLLNFGWLFSNLIFSVYLTMPPLHRGELFTSKSPDKNGSLIDGLHRRERQLNCMLAFWELFRISVAHPERRRELFTDIDPRPGAWERVRAECMSLLTEIEQNLKPKNDKKKKKEDKNKPATQPVIPSQALPGVIEIKHTNVFSRPGGSGHTGIQSVQDQNATSSKRVVGAVELYAARLRAYVRATPKALEFVTRSRWGAMLRITLRRKARRIVPNPNQTCAGVFSLAYLTVHSRTEDTYGVVQGGISGVLSELDVVSTGLAKYMANPPRHWSDKRSSDNFHKNNGSKDSNSGNTNEDEEALSDLARVKEAVDDAFGIIVGAFYANLDDLGLTPAVRLRIRELTSRSVLE